MDAYEHIVTSKRILRALETYYFYEDMWSDNR